MLSNVPQITQNSCGDHFLPLSVQLQKLGTNSYEEVYSLQSVFAPGSSSDLHSTPVN